MAKASNNIHGALVFFEAGHPTQDTLLASACHRLLEDDQQRITKHLVGCGSCQTQANAWVASYQRSAPPNSTVAAVFAA